MTACARRSRVASPKPRRRSRISTCRSTAVSMRCSGCARRSMRPRRRTRTASPPTSFRSMISSSRRLALALMRVPEANVSWTESAMLKHKDADVGVAVSIPGGLITPIVRKAQSKTLSVISNEMKDLAQRAKARKLKPQEYEGGTTAVSNLGMFGVTNFSAVINPPHATILAVGVGEKRVVVKRRRARGRDHDVGHALDRPPRRRRRARRGASLGLQDADRASGFDAGLKERPLRKPAAPDPLNSGACRRDASPACRERRSRRRSSGREGRA